MPSIPQSLLWISLVVLWLFVLVPMLISKRDAVRRTSDVALATRVLNSDAASRLLKRGGPAAGHRSDPDWQPEEDEYDDDLEDLDSDDTEEVPLARGDVVTVAAGVSVEETGPDCLDAEVGETDIAALRADGSAVVADALPTVEEQPEPVAEDETADSDEAEAEFDTEDDDTVDDEGADQYEYVDDTSGIPVAEEPAASVTHAFSRRQRYDSNTAAAVSARKYVFRKRVLMVIALTLVGSASAAFLLTPTAWWFCGSTAAVTVLYLGYLRRQTRIEARVQRRRTQRMARSRLGVENTYDHEFDVVPSRLRRPGAVVLEIDDEDPVFEHLDYAPYARDYGWHRDLPRAAGQ
jgi:hypothetical protein